MQTLLQFGPKPFPQLLNLEEVQQAVQHALQVLSADGS
jgi:hypothetical protein